MTLRLRIAILILLVIPPVIHACLANQNDEITQLARLSIAVRKYMLNCSLTSDNAHTSSSYELYGTLLVYIQVHNSLWKGLGVVCGILF